LRARRLVACSDGGIAALATLRGTRASRWASDKAERKTPWIFTTEPGAIRSDS
jgi:hypothetical protein